ncbi:hypothetical protein B6U80_00350 [Candidatus Pacearchaeota archaeon ex4484_26]|nr:MAG: hypothetical protein B6U80_00350 [Candidatus Pacearchaeota archaeon ex4484_26]
MLEKMIKKAIILAGGKGERLRPLTYETPKPLLEFRGKMMIEHIFEMLKREGIIDVTLTLCYLPEVFKERLGDGSKFGLNINYVVENEPLGTAGFLRSMPLTETTFVINSDVFFTNFDVKTFLAKHKKFTAEGAYATLALAYVENTQGLGTVKLNGERIEDFIEKEQVSNYVNAGHYLLEPSVMKIIKDLSLDKKKIMFETDIFPKLAEKGKLFAYLSDAEWIHIRDLEAYEKLKD